MINLLLCGMTENPGGKETYIFNVFKYLDKNRFHVYFLAMDPVIAYEDEIKKMGGEVLHIPNRCQGLFKYIASLKKVFKQHHIDVIWSHKTSLSSSEDIYIAKKYGVPCRLVHAHQSANMGSKFTYVMHCLNRLFIPYQATDLYSCSKVASTYFYKKHSSLVLPNFFDVDSYQYDLHKRQEWRQALKIDNEPVIGHVGRFQPEKNHEKILTVFREFLKFYPNAKLLLCGDGERRHIIEDKIKELHLENKVILTGIVNNVKDYLQVMDYFILPSFFEGLPYVALEAQAAGLKCLCADTVSQEINITGLVDFLPLEASDDTWASYLNAHLIYDRSNKYNYLLKEKKFDIKSTIKEIEGRLKIQ